MCHWKSAAQLKIRYLLIEMGILKKVEIYISGCIGFNSTNLHCKWSAQKDIQGKWLK